MNIDHTKQQKWSLMESKIYVDYMYDQNNTKSGRGLNDFQVL